MLTGLPGSGKELAARFIHANSNRASAPFISVSSATVEPDRMEEVLFGRETAERGVEPGLLEQAHGGVVYFDEVGDMPLGTQSKILRVLTEQQFTRAGGTDKVRVDLRVISSTTRDLPSEIRVGRFRQELFDRLNVVPIPVPPLADRREDIPELIQYFIGQVAQTSGLAPRRIGEDAIAVLQAHDWPGNVRELENALERGAVLCQNDVIMPEHLPPRIIKAGLAGDGPVHPLLKPLARVEEDHIRAVLESTQGNRSRTAKILGISQTTLWRKLKGMGILTEDNAV